MVILHCRELKKKPSYFPPSIPQERGCAFIGLIADLNHLEEEEKTRTHKNMNTFLINTVWPCCIIHADDICDERHFNKRPKGRISHDRFHYVHAPQFHMLSLFLSCYLFFSSPSALPILSKSTAPTHTLFLTALPPVLIYTPIQTQRWINSTFSFRMRKMPCLIVSLWHDVWSHLMQLCKSAIVIAIFLFTAWYVLNNYLPTSDAASCGLFFKK